MTTLIYILLALILLGVLVAIHELGHFLSAWLCGIPVKEYSIGFGPAVWKHVSKKSGTLYALRPVPLGGYCMFYGETASDPDEAKLERDDPRNYNGMPVWKRAVSVACGPLMNFVLAFVLAVLMMAVFGGVADKVLVSQVEAGMPAETAGLQAGDVFLEINGTDVSGMDVYTAGGLMNCEDPVQPIRLMVERDGEPVRLEMLPAYDEAEQRYRIGIMMMQTTKRMPAGLVIPAAWDLCREVSTALVDGLARLFSTGEGLQDASGPVGIVKLVAEETQQYGMEMYLYLAVLISVNLGIMNLLPIPGLDGSRLVFLLIEAVIRRPVNKKVETVVYLCGYVLLFGFMIFITFRDVWKLFL